MSRDVRKGPAPVDETEFDDLTDEEVEALLAQDDPDLNRPSSLAWRRRTAIEMVVSGLIGLYASFVLSIEAVYLAGLAEGETPNLSCDLSATISCSTVAQHWAATLLGFPNAFLGIAAEAVVLTVAVALIGGVRFPRWFMLTAQVIYTIGFVFAIWLFGMAFFVIKALCPWCLLITLTTTLVWAGLTRINIRDGDLTLPGRAGPWARRFVAHGYDWYVTVAFLAGIAAMIVLRYGGSIIA